MRQLRIGIFLLLAAALVLPQIAAGADRIVLLENFTNVSCGPCATANPTTAQFVEDYGSTEPISIINVQYHVWWPGSTDPLYLAALTDCVAATNYYGVNAVPDLMTDGANTPNPGDYDAMEDEMNARLAIPSPLTIDVTHSIGLDCQLTVQATIHAEDVVPAGMVARIALVESEINYDSPPGSNGEMDFYCTLRKMLPDFYGTPLTITNGETVVLTEVVDLDPNWSRLYAVVWVQDTATNEVLQSGRSWPADDVYWKEYDLTLEGTKPIGLTELGSTIVLTSELENTGLYTDTFDISLDKSGLPIGWTATACLDGQCFAPFITSFSVPLNPGETASIEIEMTPMGTPGSGTVVYTANGRGNECVSAGRVELTAVTAGPPILLVDDDGGSGYEAFYESSLGNLGKEYLYWDLGLGKLSADDLAYFDTVIWFTGRNYNNVVDAEDMAAIGAYLAAGGKLFMSGQLIGYSIYNYYATEGPVWHQTYLGADWVKYDERTAVSGYAGDAIADGMAFDITGGDGASNQSYPSVIEAYGSGVLSFEYDGNPQGDAATHLDSGTFKSVYFAFSFEGIAQSADRDAVMNAVLAFLNGSSPVLDLPGSKPYLASVPEAAPNPFNPSTTIRFDIGGTSVTDMTVSVYDLRGRLVRTLHDGPAQPGPQVMNWNGLDESGETVASGVYLTRIAVADDGQVLKVTLTK